MVDDEMDLVNWLGMQVRMPFLCGGRDRALQ